MVANNGRGGIHPNVSHKYARYKGVSGTALCTSRAVVGHGRNSCTGRSKANRMKKTKQRDNVFHNVAPHLACSFLSVDAIVTVPMEPCGQKKLEVMKVKL